MIPNNKDKKGTGNSLTKKQRSWIYTGFFVCVIILLFIINNLGG